MKPNIEHSLRERMVNPGPGSRRPGSAELVQTYKHSEVR